MLNVFQNDQYIQYILFTLHIEISLSLSRSINFLYLAKNIAT